MIRAAFVFLFVLVVLAVAFAVAGDPGSAHLIWGGWRVDTTAAMAAILIGVLSLIAVAFWRIGLWIAEAPRRAERARAENRRRQTAEALSRGYLALAAGEGPEARRLAAKAADLGEENSALTRVLAAQAAELAGDLPTAQSAYAAMLGFPEMRLAGHRGLMKVAIAQGDTVEAVKQAGLAYNLAKTARWAWRALFEAKLQAGEWAEALDLVEGGLSRKILTPAVAERARAALLAASAASLETAADPKLRDQAVDYAARAAKQHPGFAPGAVIAARLLADAGKTGKAEDVLENAFAAAPHPALWLAYRDLRDDETPRERAKRLQKLVNRNREHREGRILAAEVALLAHDPVAIGAAMDALSDEKPTARLCGLHARAAWAAGQADEARAWVARGSAAPQEPDWSDLDPEGRAFAYGQSDWTRLVSSFAETGELVHPRFERRERVLSDLPELPARYEISAPFVSAAETGALPAYLPDDPGFYDDALAGPPEPEPGSQAAQSRPRAPRPPPRRDRSPRRRPRQAHDLRRPCAGGLGKTPGSV